MFSPFARHNSKAPASPLGPFFSRRAQLRSQAVMAKKKARCFQRAKLLLGGSKEGPGFPERRPRRGVPRNTSAYNAKRKSILALDHIYPHSTLTPCRITIGRAKQASSKAYRSAANEAVIHGAMCIYRYSGRQCAVFVLRFRDIGDVHRSQRQAQAQRDLIGGQVHVAEIRG